MKVPFSIILYVLVINGTEVILLTGSLTTSAEGLVNLEVEFLYEFGDWVDRTIKQNFLNNVIGQLGHFIFYCNRHIF